MTSPPTTLEPLAELRVRRAPNNPKAHDLGAIRSSFERFGFVSPVLENDTDGTVAEGHGRIDTLWELYEEGAPPPEGIEVVSDGTWLVPTVHVRIPPGEADAYRIASNRTVELGGWDQTRLTTLLQELAGQTQGLSGLGFDWADLERNIAEITNTRSSKADAEAIPSLGDSPPSHLRPGSLVHMGDHRLLVGDSTHLANVRRAAGELRPKCMWTDPPYGVSYVGGTSEALTIANDSADGLHELLTKSFSAADAVLAPGSAIYICHPAGPSSMLFANAFCAEGWSYRQQLVWMKQSLVLGRSDYQYRHEPILYGFKPGRGRLGRGGKAWYGGNDASSVFEVPRPSASRDHPTAKPVRLIELMLRNSTRNGDVVLDPFAGSGSTLIACEILGRTFVGLELEPRYAQVTVDRWERFSGGVAVLEDGDG